MRSEYVKSGINGTKLIRNLDEQSQRIIGIISVDSIDGDGLSVESGTPNIPDVCINKFVLNNQKSVT